MSSVSITSSSIISFVIFNLVFLIRCGKRKFEFSTFLIAFKEVFSGNICEKESTVLNWIFLSYVGTSNLVTKNYRFYWCHNV